MLQSRHIQNNPLGGKTKESFHFWISQNRKYEDFKTGGRH
jgi:hypothetical protein